ncbi:MAG: DUF1329 domain-containing protein [Deltaproteobacteria bacterium]
MLRKRYRMAVPLVVLCVLLCVPPQASADVSPGEIIDKTNWEEADGLVPEPLLNWVKNGRLVLDLGKLNYDPSIYWPKHVLEALQGNIGKYDIDEEGWIVETATGNPAEHIVGFPFPKIEMDDPRAGEKIIHNKAYTWYFFADFWLTYQILWIGSSSGLERTVSQKVQQKSYQGWPGISELRNPDGLEKSHIGLAVAPADLKGIAILTWRYVSPEKQDSTFGYVPAIRRVRQMSPANRSDAIAGSDMCADDGNGYDGKVQAFEWKLLRQQEAIVAYIDENPQALEQNEYGEWCTTNRQKYAGFGFEKEGWQGVTWAPTDYVWVRRPVYVLEMRSKDKYYNYGTQYIWIDAETYASYYKVIYDRAGDYWKTGWGAFSGYESPGKEMLATMLSHAAMVDDRSNHASGSELASPNNRIHLFAEINERDFSLAGFQKFCK